MTQDKKIHILESTWDGLGDHLRLSTLPELYAKAGYDVYLHKRAEFKNEQIEELIVDHNPYILGITDERLDKSIYPEGHHGIEYLPVQHSNYISNIEMFHGFEPTNTKPKIYYDAEFLPEHEDIVLVDMGSVSAEWKSPHDSQELIEKVQKLQETKFKGKKLVQVLIETPVLKPNKKIPYVHPHVLDDKILVEDIFHYCDLMRSCYGIIALDSGATHLASAMHRQNPDLRSVCLMERNRYHDFVSRSLLINENTDYILLDKCYNKT